MSIIDRILGRTPTEGPQIHAPGKAASASRPAPITELPTAPVAAPPLAGGVASEGMIRVYDQFGRAVTIGREAWRQDVLLPNLQSNRNNPDALYDLVVSALNDGFATDLLDSARHLAETDPQPQRGAMVLGIVLLQLKDHAGAREVLERAIARYGDNPYLLANLARAFAAAGEDERAQALIWRALELEPNEETALNWLIGMLRDRGQEAVAAAYTRAATLPGSWRALLWLARYALERGDLAEATRLYEEALARAIPVPAGPADADERGSRQSRPHRTADEADAATIRSARARTHRGQQPAARLRGARHVRRSAQAARAALFAAASGLARAAHRLGAEAR